jgi:UDP-N-acetylglucosamine 4,6-dehydratase/5-epimerase
MTFDWKNQVVLVTGGTGSFGKQFVETMLKQYQPHKLIIFSRDELKQHEMRVGGFDHPALRYFIGDVRDVERLRRAMQGVDIVVHAAALKQVPACEYNPIEAVATNVTGAKNVIEAALDKGVKKVLAMSTDKATAPVNLYGATKLVAEKLFVQANAYSGKEGTRFACVRYGNVVGSRGSVVPLFNKQKAGGKITITDKRMTRFWITLEQGVQFVISSIEQMHGGEVFIPKIPSMNIMDLATVLAPECEFEFIGTRPGEKLHESMISVDEARQAVELEDRYVILPAHPWWQQDNWNEGKPLPEGFSYSSDSNDIWLTAVELQRMIDES